MCSGGREQRKAKKFFTSSLCTGRTYFIFAPLQINRARLFFYFVLLSNCCVSESCRARVIIVPSVTINMCGIAMGRAEKNSMLRASALKGTMSRVSCHICFRSVMTVRSDLY